MNKLTQIKGEGKTGVPGEKPLVCSPFSQKIRQFLFEVKWKGNFPENLFGNCGQPPDVVLSQVTQAHCVCDIGKYREHMRRSLGLEIC